MVNYIPLPAFRAPSGIDFGPLNDGLDVLGKTIERNKLLQESKDRLKSATADSPAPSQNRLLSTSSTPAQYGAANAMDGYKSSIASIESAGSKQPYQSLGPVVKSGDRAYGKYQVMGSNIGPWTQEILGRSMTPEEFLANPEAQEKVFEGKFGQYVQKTGNPRDAASMWFTGRPAAQAPNARAQDAQGRPLGITGQQYVDRFSAGIGGAPAPQAAPAAAPQAPRSGMNYDAAMRTAAQQGDEAAFMRYAAMKQEDAQTAQSSELNSLKIQGTREELATKAQTKLAAVAQRVAEMPPEQAAAVWPKVLAVNPRLASTLQQYGIDPNDYKAGTALIVAEARGLSPATDKQRYTASRQGVLDTYTGEIKPLPAGSEGASAEFGTSTKAFEDKDGNIQYMQFSKAGGGQAVKLPEGAKWRPDVEIKDIGTGLVPISKQTGQPIGPAVPKEVAQKEALEERGKLAGQAQAAMPAAETSVKFAKQKIAQLRAHPGLEGATGLSNVMDPRNYAPGSAGFDFIEMNKQAEAKTFMVAREALKGAGQVTDFEGKRGEQAISNLNAAQSKEQYLAALTELEQMMDASIADLRQKATVPGSAPQAAPPPAQTEQRRLRFNPETGELE